MYEAYVANLIHQDTRSVIKVVRYGLNIQCYLDVHAVELGEKQTARGRKNIHASRSGRFGQSNRRVSLTITLEKSSSARH